MDSGSNSRTGSETVRIFVSYAREDRRWLDPNDQRSLIPFLKDSLKKQHVLFWYDEGLIPGEEFKRRIESEIDGADIALLIVSQDFLNSEFIEKEEMPRIASRAKLGKMVILPILVGPCDWHEYGFLADRHMVPASRPLIEFTDSDISWSKIRKEILDGVKAQIKQIWERKQVQGQAELKAAAGEEEAARRTGTRPPPPQAGARKWRWQWWMLAAALAIAVVVIAGYGWYRHSQTTISSASPYAASVPRERRWDAFMGAIPWERWVVYDPTEYDPYHDKFPSDMSIREDLQTLQRRGFNGLITMSSRGTLKDIAKIAHESGFQMVIVGVWDLRNTDEIDAALSVKEYADAYCVGHTGLAKRYTFGELREMVVRFQNTTGRPVAVSELFGEYKANSQLVALGDFLFPDAHPEWHEGETPEAAWAETVEAARKAAQLVSNLPDREILLTMISFPSGGARGLTPTAQAQFYRLAVEGARDNKNIPARVAFSFMGAFDTPWKTVNHGWTLPEQSTGLFTVKREPKPSVLNVRWVVAR